MKVTKADWAATVPWNGVIGRPDVITPGEAEYLQSQIDALKKAIANIPVYPPPTDGTVIKPFNAPARAVLQRPLNQPYAPFEAIWQREWYDVRLFGGSGTRGPASSTTDAINEAIRSLNDNGGGVLYFPTGQYNVMGDILFAITEPCLILGDGPSLSQLTFETGGFVGPDDGQDFGVSGLAMLTDGTSGFSEGITISDGTSAGTGKFALSNLRINGWDKAMSLSAPSRSGMIQNIRYDYRSIGMDLDAMDVMIADIWAENIGDTSSITIHTKGDGHRLSFLSLYSPSNPPGTAIWVEIGSSVQISDTMIDGTDSYAIILDSGTNNCRVTDSSIANCAGSTLIDFDPTKHYVNNVQGMGGNTDTSCDDRRELSLTQTWDPASIRPLESVTMDFTLVGASPGDQVIVGAPYTLTFGQVSGVVTATDTVTVTVTNLSTDTIDLASGDWSIRIFH